MSEAWRNRTYISIYKNKNKEKVRRFPLIGWKSAQKETKTVETVTEEKKTVVCPACGRELDRAEVVTNCYICTVCGGYFRVRTNNRIRMICDRNTFTEWFAEVAGSNPLHFPDYEEKLREVREKTGLLEGFTVGAGEIYGEKAVLGICDARFLMGSMGHVVGEKIALAVERATEEKLPVKLFTCS